MIIITNTRWFELWQKQLGKTCKLVSASRVTGQSRKTKNRAIKVKLQGNDSQKIFILLISKNKKAPFHPAHHTTRIHYTLDFVATNKITTKFCVPSRGEKIFVLTEASVALVTIAWEKEMQSQPAIHGERETRFCITIFLHRYIYILVRPPSYPSWNFWSNFTLIPPN